MRINEDYFSEEEFADIPEYYNIDYAAEATKISSEVIERFNEPKIYGGHFIEEAKIKILKDYKIVRMGSGSRMTFQIESIEWLEELDIIVTDDVGLFEDSDTEDDFFVAANQCSYYLVGNADRIVKQDIVFDISQGLAKIPNYVVSKNNDCLRKATLVFIMSHNKDYTENYIAHVILHETTHLYHMFKYSPQIVNKLTLNHYFNPEGKYKFLIDKLSNANLFISTREHIFKTQMTASSFGDYMLSVLDDLKWSEMNAYCYTFRGELIKIISKYGYNLLYDRNPSLVTKEQFLKVIPRYSKYFGKFYAIRENFKAAISSMPRIEKIAFAKNDMAIFYSRELEDGQGFPFDKDFSNNGIFDEHSFDEMMKHIINQLNYNFINVCYNIYMEYYRFYSDNILKEHHSAAYSLSNDYFYLYYYGE